MARARDSRGKFIKEHGMTKTKLYRVWCSMRERCNNSHNKSYKNYGRKGIRVCEDWEKSFYNFNEWAINNGYKEGLTIDRIDGQKGYCPENCRWTTSKIQNRNYSRNHTVIYDGKKYCLIELAEKFKINYSKLLYRIKVGYSIEEAIKEGDNRYGNKRFI